MQEAIAIQKKGRQLPLETAVAISEAESIHVNLQFKILPEEPTSETPVTLILPNYNNGDRLEAVLDSILAQRGCQFKLLILDNHSTDGTWDTICRYAQKYDHIHAEQLPFNTGPFTWGETLLRSPIAGYMMPCSGNDALLGNKVVASFAAYLDRNPGVALVYGQEASPNQAKPSEYTFSIPEPSRRHIYGELTTSHCHDITTWLYYYSESLWGMYRTNLLKLLNPPCSYGSDHVIISAISCLGGVSGIRAPVRQVSDNSARGLEQLRNSQIARQHSTVPTVLTPLENTNFMMLAYSYFQGIRDSHFVDVNRDQLVFNVIEILYNRFQERMKEEMLIYSNLFPRIRALAEVNVDLQLLHRIETEDSFVRHYMINLLASIA